MASPAARENGDMPSQAPAEQDGSADSFAVGHEVVPDSFEFDDDEDVELSLVRTAFAAALAEAIGDKGLIDAPSRTRQDRAQLVEVMQTQLHGKEIEELHFIATSFGLAAIIELDPIMPEGHEGRVTVSIKPTGRSYV